MLLQDQKRFAILEVAADWHELMIPQRTMRPSIARMNEQLDPLCVHFLLVNITFVCKCMLIAYCCGLFVCVVICFLCCFFIFIFFFVASTGACDCIE